MGKNIAIVALFATLLYMVWPRLMLYFKIKRGLAKSFMPSIIVQGLKLQPLCANVYVYHPFSLLVLYDPDKDSVTFLGRVDDRQSVIEMPVTMFAITSFSVIEKILFQHYRETTSYPKIQKPV